MARLSCKPFKTTHDEQIKLVTSFDLLDLSALHGIDEELWELLRGSLFIDKARCDALCRGLQIRVEMLTDVINSHMRAYAVNSEAWDVAENIAYSGSIQEDDSER